MLPYEFLEKFFSDSTCLIAVIDRHQRVRYHNMHLIDGVGTQWRSKDLPRCFELFYPGQNRCCDSCHVKEVFASGQTLIREKAHPRLGHLKILCLPIRNNQGEVQLVIEQICPAGTHQHIDQREARLRTIAENTEQQLRRERDLARHYFDIAEVMMVVLDREGRICQLNRKGCQLLGFSEKELIGQDWFDNCLPQRERLASRQFFDDIICGKLPLGQKGENWVQTHDGRELLISWSSSNITDDNGQISHLISCGEDITEHRRDHQALTESETRFQYLAHHDALTNLPNRLLFYDRMEHALEKARRYKRQMALFFLDLDRLKNINDSLGHSVGDQVLVAFAHKLQQLMRKSDTLARLSGDEFVVLCEDVNSIDHASLLAEKILGAFGSPLHVAGHTIHAPVSIGIALLDAEMDKAHDLLRAADSAMYRAKKAGGHRYAIYDSASSIPRRDIFHLESHLRQAVERGETFLQYQPQIDLQSGRLIGVEALARWEHPRLGMISPEEFIAVAEETGQIVALGDWVVETACAQNKAWQDAGLAPITMAVNISPHQLSQADFSKRIQRILTKTGLDPSLLEIEITETAIMDNGEKARETMRGLCELGISFALDDFGTGYSSLSNLRYLPLKKLKIDRSFIHDVPHSDPDVRLVSSVLALASSLDLQVVAEGIETEPQLVFLQQKGSEIGQGYFFSRPVAAAEVEKLMSRNFLGL
ncbi:MAG: EAL domain-containing protein [Desulfuromonadaceae bacterium]|nr:EAL domain-containing protein [Desulfuromonadaceae bacterium]